MKSSLRFVMSTAVLLVVLSGCSSDTAPNAKAIDGPWNQDSLAPGSFVIFQLTSENANVLGTGMYCGEAGPCGRVSVVGTVDGFAVHLDLTLVQELPTGGVTTVEHFDGKFVGAYTLVGTETVDVTGSGAQSVTYRHPVVDPV